MDNAVSQLLVSTTIANQDEWYLQGLIHLFLLHLLVNDDVGVAILLKDHAKRAEVKNVEEVFDDKLIGEEDPLSILHKGDDCLVEEGQMFSGGLVAGSLGFSGVVGASDLAVSNKLVMCPWGCGEGTKGHGGKGDPAAGQSGWGASQNWREGGNPG
jgi:hypothetical protein